MEKITANNFIPSESLKQLHQVELDLLEELKRVCRENNLRYFASGGTLLGAVRHKGFIPWDDDIDVRMMWSDFKKLMVIAPDVFSEPYFFQSYKTSPYEELSNAKLRRSDTTGCTKWEYDNIKTSKYNRGIFLDVFPLFAIPKDESMKARQKKIIDETWRSIRGWNAVQNHQAGLLSVYDQYIPDWEKMSQKYTIEQIKQLYMDACAMAEEDETDEIGETTFRTHNEKFIWKRKWYDETIELPFEETTISCPKMYEEILTKQYGDWRTPIYNASMHEMYIYDVETPYKQRNDLY